MARKYKHPLTKELQPDNWKEKINLDDLTVDDLMEILFDMRKMEGLSKKIGGFLKEVIKARCKDMEEYDGRSIFAEFVPGYREGNLDTELILEEMGEDWVEDHRKEGTPFTTIKLKEKADD